MVRNGSLESGHRGTLWATPEGVGCRARLASGGVESPPLTPVCNSMIRIDWRRVVGCAGEVFAGGAETWEPGE